MVGITHLVYVDDLMLFARADEPSIKVLANCLEVFGNEAGLRANSLKSHMYMAGIDDRMKNRLLQLIGFQERTFLCQYLRIPLAAEKLWITNYGSLFDTITRMINSWPNHTLSYVGRLELVKTVLQGVECYWLSMLPIPSVVTAKIKVICRTFVWLSKHPPIPWVTMCLSRHDGGYGLRDLHA
ncbi:uncharacterized protein LOC121995400 [Zingiber officinale]|uniref:uncharacterized protein LOC121995400 n=1 Tax=Zingiber officinale TaxID=94328 RepID=UPI001C4AC925|nr:uncharacterized protein LOC121995400 [Zingiber officinale]